MKIILVIGFSVALFTCLVKSKTINAERMPMLNDDADSAAAIAALYEDVEPPLEYEAFEPYETNSEIEMENNRMTRPKDYVISNENGQKDKKNNPIALSAEKMVATIPPNSVEFVKEAEDIKSIAIKSDLIMWLLVSTAGVVMIMVVGLAVWVRLMDDSSCGRMKKLKDYVNKLGEWKKSKPKPNNPLASTQSYNDEKIDIMDIDRTGRSRAEEDTDEENEDEADYTVYECQGPASASDEMEIRNPLFHSKMGGGNEMAGNN